MPVTQKDIADKASVSRSLVARVLLGDSGVRVTEQKRSHIMRVAKELGYRPNLVASNLRRGKTGAVVVITKYDATNYTPHALRGVTDTLAVKLAQVGYELKLRPYRTMDDILAGIDEIASSSACDAAVLWIQDNEGEHAGEALENRGIPFVISGYFEERHPDWRQVDFDHNRMSCEAVDFLCDRDHKNIAYFGFGFDGEAEYAIRLRHGFEQQMLTRVGEIPHQWTYHVTNDIERTVKFVESWLDLPPDQRPTAAVVGANDKTWVGIEVAMARHGVRIGYGPDEFAVVGLHFGDIPLLYGQGQSFSIEMAHMAEVAADILTRKVLGSQLDTPKIVRIQPELAPIESLNLPLPTVV